MLFYVYFYLKKENKNHMITNQIKSKKRQVSLLLMKIKIKHFINSSSNY